MTKDELKQLEYDEVERNLKYQEKVAGLPVSEEVFKDMVQHELTFSLLERYIKVHTTVGSKMFSVMRNLYDEMNPIEQKIYKELPEFVEIYRGCNRFEIEKNRGQSWTADLNTARYFAWTYYEKYKRDNDRVVLKATIPKDYIYAYVHRKNECEYIIEPEKLLNVKIHLETEDNEIEFRKYLFE